jgi:hypothetical protein
MILAGCCIFIADRAQPYPISLQRNRIAKHNPLKTRLA